MWVFIGLVIVFLLLVKCVYDSKHAHKKLSWIPGPPPEFFIGSVKEVDTVNPLRTFHKYHLQYGTVYKAFMFSRPIISVNDPILARQILQDPETFTRGEWSYTGQRLAFRGIPLFNIEGPLWKVRRTRLNPHFSTASFKKFVPAIESKILTVLEYTKQYKALGNVDIDGFFIGITFDIISQFIYGGDWDCSSPTSKVRHIIQETFEFISNEMRIIGGFPLWASVPDFFKKKYVERIRQTYALIKDLCDKRAREGLQKKGDILDILLVSGIPRNEVYDELIGLFFAGHDTTAHTMTWFIYYINKYPEVLAKLRKEIMSVVPPIEEMNLSDNWNITEAHRRLPYFNAVVNEVMRSKPPSGGAPKTTTAETKLGSYVIPAETDLLVNTYSMTRSPHIWDNPETFDPNRFLNTNRDDIFMPFLVGPHTCIGK